MFTVQLLLLGIRIRIHMFLGLSDPHPDLLDTNTDPDPSNIKQK
jgi:hypothetical protein